MEIPIFDDSQACGVEVRECEAQIQRLLGAILSAEEIIQPASPRIVHAEDLTIIRLCDGMLPLPRKDLDVSEGIVATIEATKMPSSSMSVSKKILTDGLLLYSNQDAMSYRLCDHDDVTILCQSHIPVDRADSSSSNS
jgi:hypothetical protein